MSGASERLKDPIEKYYRQLTQLSTSNLPTDTPTCTYRLAAEIDVAPGVLPEPPPDGETNNIKQADEPEIIEVIGPTPDLVSVGGSGSIAGPNAADPGPYLGEPYTITSEVRNDGAAPVSGSFSIAYSAIEADADDLAKGVTLGQTTFPLDDLASGGTRAVTFTSGSGLANLQPDRAYNLRATLRHAGDTLEALRVIGSFTVRTGPGTTGPGTTGIPDLEPLPSTNSIVPTVMHKQPDGTIADPLNIAFKIRNNRDPFSLNKRVSVGFVLEAIVEEDQQLADSPSDERVTLGVRTFIFVAAVGQGAATQEISFGPVAFPLTSNLKPGKYKVVLKVDPRQAHQGLQ